MLSKLTISNYALIEQLDFTPDEGFSIITGETGAGKSVMLGALSLLKGERADMKVISDKSKKAVVEAIFTDLDDSVASAVSAIDSEWEGGELIIRREIHPSGRSRAFINDTPATLGQLSELTRGLLDIHSQNSNTLLSEQRTQLQLIDTVADNGSLLDAYSEDFRRYISLRQRIRKIREEAAKNREQSEVIAFRLGVLDKLKPKGGELSKIEARYETLSNSEETRERLVRARRCLDGVESSGALGQLEEALSVLSGIDFTLWEEEDPEISDRLKQCVVEIKDMVETIDDAIGIMEYEPSTLESLSARMKDYYSALRNFRVETDSELEAMHASLKARMDSMESEGMDSEILDKQARECAQALKAKASAISARRREASIGLQEEIEEEARKLGLENLRFEIVISEAKLSKTGGDMVEFRAAFNKNGILLPVGEMASGGEMARLMLAIKKITASRLKLPTIIFDEIDTGVSGGIADRMGEMMREMGEVMQILTITHLPQVAVKGTRHFKVYKEDRGEKTVSDVMLLSPGEREEEIGRMLSGREIDEAALNNARSLLRGKMISENGKN